MINDKMSESVAQLHKRLEETEICKALVVSIEKPAEVGISLINLNEDDDATKPCVGLFAFSENIGFAIALSGAAAGQLGADLACRSNRIEHKYNGPLSVAVFQCGSDRTPVTISSEAFKKISSHCKSESEMHAMIDSAISNKLAQLGE